MSAQKTNTQKLLNAVKISLAAQNNLLDSVHSKYVEKILRLKCL